MQLGGEVARHGAGLRWNNALDKVRTPLVDCRQHEGDSRDQGEKFGNKTVLVFAQPKNQERWRDPVLSQFQMGHWKSISSNEFERSFFS